MLDEVSFLESSSLFVHTECAEPSSYSAKKTLNKHSAMHRFLRERDDLKSLLLWIEHSSLSLKDVNKNSLLSLLLKTVSELDSLIEKQINIILHNKDFQKLEASWRGLSYLIDQKELHDKEEQIKIKVLDCSWQTLSKDLDKAIEFDQSEFFKLIYSNEYDMSGGEPFGVVIGDYQVSHKHKQGFTTNDIDTLKDISRVAAAAFTPFITSAHPSLFAVDDFSDLGAYINWSKNFEQSEYIKWQSLRDMEESRYLGITLPNILMRAPYKADGTRSEAFKFKEVIKDPQKEQLWGNAAYAFSGVLVRAYAESGWFGQIRGMQPGYRKKGLVCDLPVSQYETDRYRKSSKPSVNLQVGDRAEKILSDNGFIPISSINGCDHLVFFSNASVQKPGQYNTLAATVNAKLSSMLQYILCVSRFAHYLKVLGREKLGTYSSAELCEQDLQRWLLKYTAGGDSASEELRSRYPLYSAQVKVREMVGKPGYYCSVIQLQPHFQLDQMVSSIKLVTELTPQN
ncbi:type VI secretion system contractile sheath large subunit [Psychromonas aquimarina]|uniref:type VI secretion system contractile sheath large subunit n=1 Tax=Psychromonas aquimarina TaxID=444919 RepID=UPI0004159409|nr:type VI secretion system contractile sheath large subunit [Psychromonas aquimarina]